MDYDQVQPHHSPGETEANHEEPQCQKIRTRTQVPNVARFHKLSYLPRSELLCILQQDAALCGPLCSYCGVYVVLKSRHPASHVRRFVILQ